VRELVPILADEEKALWIVGYRRDERASLAAPAAHGIVVEFFKG
jgi:hypothetical protein